jgi:hypothetical protein
MDQVVVEKLKERYPHLHPLLFHRSVEKAQTLGELFDILEEVPVVLPVAWDEESRRWKTTDDLTQARSFE